MKRCARFVFYVDTAGEHRWRVVAANGRKLADSGEGYKSLSKCVAGAKKTRLAELPERGAR